MKKLLILAVFSALIVSVSSVSIYAQSQYDIPAWVKGIAGFWAEDKISDSEFGEGLAFLIDNEIIKVPLIQELENKISELEAENSELRDKLNLPEPEVSISAKTNYHSYTNLDAVKVSGTVNPFIEHKVVRMIVISPEGEIVLISQIGIKYNGAFSDSFVAGGPLWKSSGDYIIKLAYDTATTEIVIKYIGGELPEDGTTPNVSFTNSRIVDPFGNTVTQVEVTKVIQIAADATNSNNFSQDFTYYITIRETGDEFWITGSLSPNQSFSPTLAWRVPYSGTFTADISMFDNIQNKNKLAESLTLQITAE